MPAIVFSKTPPSGSVIEVADTTTALGFHVPMFAADWRCLQIHDDLFAISGIFHIPVPDVQRGDLWSGVIQNAICFISGISFYVDAQPVSVKADWSPAA